MPFLLFQCLKDAPDRDVEIASILAATKLRSDELTVVRPFNAPITASVLDGAEGVIIGGAGWSAFEDIPYYGDFLVVLKAARERRVPMLGICFGAQTLAHLFGGAVVRDDLNAEYGTIDVDCRSTSFADPLLAEAPPRFAAQSWHHDRIAELPSGAMPLAWSRDGAVLQAFSFPGERIWGVQFHPERTAETFERVLEHRTAPDDAHPIGTIRASLRPSPQAAALLERFVRIARGR
jgi:GMP synthase (glutamine-hydrolysing)